jgi:quercetin dioxygenase-like cupin family protein
MTVLEGGGLVLLPGESRTIRASGFRVLEYATAEVTGGLYSLIETVESEPGAGPPLHVHRNAAEAFYVIEGEYRMHLDGRDFLCAAGSFVYVPQGMAHTFVVARAGSRKLNLYTPPAMEGYFDELSAAIESGVDENGLAEIADRYSMDVVGPAPAGYLGHSEAEEATPP